MNTQVLICRNIPFDNSYSDVRMFTSESEQNSYFQGKAIKILNDYSYQRVNYGIQGSPRLANTIRVDCKADEIMTANYIAFQNKDYNGKWFYCFVKSINYVNDNCSVIEYEIDYYQTWLFQLSVQPSFVLREHTNNDVRFANTQPEPITTKGSFCVTVQDIHFSPPYYIIVCTSTENDVEKVEKDWGELIENAGTVSGQIIQNVYQGLKFTQFRTAEEANAFIQSYSERNILDRIVMVFMSPFDINNNVDNELTLNPCPTGTSGYTPRNKKCLQYPYQYLKVSNNKDMVKEWAYEGFCAYGVDPYTGAIEVQEQPPRVRYSQLVGPPPQVVVNPIMYWGLSATTDKGEFDQGVTLSGFPTCSWVGNAFAGWLDSTLTNSALTLLATGIASVIGTPAAGASVLGASIGGVVKSAYEFGQVAIAPEKVGGLPSGNYSGMSMGWTGFSFKAMSLLPEQMMRLDSFFDSYGYATNLWKAPNLTGRASWNYVQLRDAHIIGSMPVEAITRIKQAFEDGIRIWHVDDVGNLLRDNHIIGG